MKLMIICQKRGKKVIVLILNKKLINLQPHWNESELQYFGVQLFKYDLSTIVFHL